MTEPPRRWHLYVVDLEPSVRSKPGKQRPCLAIQPTELAQAGLGSTVVLPLTTNLVEGEAFPLRVRVPAGTAGLEHNSDLLIDQILAWDNSLFVRELGFLPEAIQEEVKAALSDFLDLSKPRPSALVRQDMRALVDLDDKEALRAALDDGAGATTSLETLRRIIEACGFELSYGITESDTSEWSLAQRNLKLTHEQRLDQLVRTVAFARAGRDAMAAHAAAPTTGVQARGGGTSGVHARRGGAATDD